MPRILIQNLFDREIQVDELSKTLLSHFQDHYLDWLHSCGAKGKCTTCKVIVTEGISNFSDLSDAERKYRLTGLLANDERLACQARINGDVSIKVPNENMLPHISYST